MKESKEVLFDTVYGYTDLRMHAHCAVPTQKLVPGADQMVERIARLALNRD